MLTVFKKIFVSCTGMFFFLDIFFRVSCAETTRPADYSGSQKVWIDFNTGKSGGIRLSFPDRAVFTQAGGKRCARTDIANKEHYLYFDIDDSFIYDGNYPVVDVVVEYLDSGKDSLKLHFDCKENFYSDNIYALRGRRVHKTDSMEWRRFSIRLDDARFANRQRHHRLSLEGKADFRIHNKFDGSEEYISYIEVRIPHMYITVPKPSNIFDSGEEVLLQLKILNREPRKKNFVLAHEILNPDGEAVDKNRIECEAAPGSSLIKEIRYKPAEKGVYFAAFWLMEDGRLLESAQTSFAVCGPISISGADRLGSPFGMCVDLADLSDNDTVSMLKAAGAGWVRFEPVWEHLESQRGLYRWEPYDAMVDLAAANNLYLYGLLGYQTAWADPTDGTLASCDAFAQYAAAVAQRYKDRVRHWEIWNEADWKGFWRGESDPAAYTKLLRQSYIRIKKADSGAKVITSGLTGNYKARGRFKFLSLLYDKGAGPYFDIVAIHPYIAPLAPEENNRLYALINDARARMRQSGDVDKRIWITELGWPTGKAEAAPHVSDERNVNLKKQADYLVRSHIISLSSGAVDKIFWYCFKNTGYDEYASEQNFGLVRADLSPKPAYAAYRVMASKLSGLDYAGQMDLKTPFLGFIFGKGDKRIKVLWSTGARQSLELPVSGENAIVTDIMGNVRSVAAANGKIVVTLDESPVYIERQNKDEE